MKLLKNYYNEAQAYIDKGMLADNGIKTVLVYNSLSDVFPAPDAGISNVELYVDHSLYDRAMSLISG
ncbi:MAG: DUF2007 domain-containing protein [Prevotella sp.]|nr:DUF2007 domain-containing protein [Prevotella sp.]MCM1075139.1 DUF2007 domain-containing protein [Ruminococcus sp.]